MVASYLILFFFPAKPAKKKGLLAAVAET